MEEGSDLLDICHEQRRTFCVGGDVSTGLWRPCRTIQHCMLHGKETLTLELWHREWAIWVLVFHHERVVPRDEWNCGQVRKTSCILGRQYNNPLRFNWINLF